MRRDTWCRHGSCRRGVTDPIPVEKRRAGQDLASMVPHGDISPSMAHRIPAIHAMGFLPSIDIPDPGDASRALRCLFQCFS
jgi:hypothetical protein